MDADARFRAAEGEHGGERGGGRGLVGSGGRVGDVIVEGGFLEAPDAVLTPAGGGDGIDQHALGWGLGLVLLDEFVEEFEESGGLFGVEDDGFGEESVAGAVAGGVAFALGGDRPFGFGSVGAGGGDLRGGSHVTRMG